MRSKEQADDYRYFPEPDLVPVAPDAALLERLREGLPELPGDRMRRFEAQHGLPFADASALNRTAALADYFEEGSPRPPAKPARPTGRSTSSRRTSTSAASSPPARRCARGARRADRAGQGRHARLAGAKQVFAALVEGEGGGAPPRSSRNAASARSPTRRAARLVDEVVAANPDQAAQFRAGKQALIGYFVGQVMKQTGGRAEPKAVQALLRQALS